MKARLLAFLLLAGCAVPGPQSGPPSGSPAPDVPARIKALNDLLAEQWEWTLRESPEFATIVGDYRYNDRLTDGSLGHVAEQRRDHAAFLERFQAIDTTGLPEQDRLNQQLMVRQLGDNIRAIDLKLFEMPVEQIGGAHLQFAQFVAYVPFETAKHYEDWLARLDLAPKASDDLIGVLEQGKKDRLMPPRFLLEKTVGQCEAIATPAGENSPFGQPLKRFPDTVPMADRQRLRDAIVAAIDTKVRPAYRKLAAYIARDYAPHGRTEPGLWALPNGEALYQFAVEQQTTTRKTPDEIHQIGLAEVARIETEQAKIAKQLGFRSLKAMRKALAKDPKAHATSRQQILDLYKKYIAQMEPRLPELFGLLPKSRVEITPIEEFREKQAAGAQYYQGTPDGSRPGRVMVNTGDFSGRTLANIETTAYHEGVPGHHLQIAIAQTLPGLPPFRQQGGYTAYAEGWALYSERLGKEVGFFQDPLSYYGHLDDELLRADRLVLDTGVHFKRWTRAQMVDFFHAHSAQSEPDIQAETDRYIVWPGQALAYKLGQLKILELRDRAKTALGAAFDIRAFHDEVLGGGALPLDVLEQRIDAWIAVRRAGAAAR
jgi:uncharacterized protein (DUF885 family)